ncbi:hypothetical protein GCM10011341_37080 [Frigidibacter albus]|nr:hypothetical protein GCM10011341_37080 [Frigidibacter albus]
MVVASTKSGVTTLQELVDKMKSGEAVDYASAGPATPMDLAGAWLARLSGGTAVQGIQYRGSAPALSDVVAGVLDYGFSPASLLMPHVREGTLVPLASATAERQRDLPDMPTMAEAGLPEFMSLNWDFWTALFAPPGTPDEVVIRVSEAVTAALNDPAVQERVASLGGKMIFVGTPPDHGPQTIDGEVAAWKQPLTEMGFIQ